MISCFMRLSVNLFVLMLFIPFNAFGQTPWTTKWTVPLTDMPNALTFFPDATHPDSVIVTYGKTIQRIKGDGSTAWKTAPSASVMTPATVADLNGDSNAEIVIGYSDGVVACLDQDGKPIWTYAAPTPGAAPRNIVVADLMPSPGKEVLFGWEDGWLNCLSAEGKLLWRFFGDKYRVGGIATGDVDGDGIPEIVYGTDNGHLYCLHHDGTLKWRYFENGPYGRSGPNLADLNGDGKVEVLITRSNAGNATCLIAVEGSTGNFLWRSHDEMQGYYSNAVVDLEGDGKFETLHTDKGNYVYCENADGKRRWQIQVAGRGIFWAPAVADIDGDNHYEIIVGVRDMDLQSKACAYVISDEGKLKASLPLGSNSNNSPIVGDVDHDQKLEVFFACDSPKQIHCITWNATGKVAWPSFRGDSAMTGATRIATATPQKAKPFAEYGEASLDAPQKADWGENTWKLTWKNAASANAAMELSSVTASGLRETWMAPVKEGALNGTITWMVDAPSRKNTVSVRLFELGKPEATFALKRKVAINPIGTLPTELALTVDNAIEAGRTAQANTSDLIARHAMLKAKSETLRSESKAGLATTLLITHAVDFQKRTAALMTSAQSFARYWESGGKQSFVWWPQDNPWVSVNPDALPKAFPDQKAPIHVTAYGDEFEDTVIMLRNITGDPISLRCSFIKPTYVETAPAKEPALAKNITFRRGIQVSTQNRGMEYDPLPELDASGIISLMPGETVPLWMVINTHGMDAGTHTLPLYLSPVSETREVLEIPVEIEVWPVKLPKGVYDQINWSGCSNDMATDQALQDMLDHGINVFYAPSVTIPVDANGKPTGTVDWKPFDTVLARLPDYSKVLLISGTPSIQWPEGMKVDEPEALYEKAFINCLQVLIPHLKTIGWGYDRWAFYPVDEPWLTGDTQIPFFRRFCKRVKTADPQARMYADPVGEVRIPKLEEFKDLVDIWQPEANMIKRGPDLEKWFYEHAKTFWIYEAPGPGKDLLPLGHYRAFAWFAWMFGCKGAGFWCYRDGDLWWPRETTDYGVVYPVSNGKVVPTIRWEAARDGNEDYRALYLLREAITKARNAGKNAEADKAQALIDEAVHFTVGWQRGVVDEISYMTRDYEIDFSKLSEYRKKIAEQIILFNTQK